MEQKETAIILDGKKYEYRKGKYSGATEACEDCALRELCKEIENDVLCNSLGVAQDNTANFQYVGEDRLTEKQIYNDYQERSVTAGNRAEQLAWAFIVILCAQLVGGEHFKEPYVIAAGGICYMLLSALQALWQAFSMWVFKQKVKRNNLMVSDYPKTIGGIAWAFYWAKMIVIAVTAVYAVIKFVQLL